MHNGFYENPKYPTPAKAKIAVVITFFETKKNYWGHFVDDKLETLKMNLAAHEHFHPGVDYDLIIINHGREITTEEFKNFPYCRYTKAWIDKPNIGYSFGGWNQAWDHYKEDYDFYCFTEDDIAPTKDGWLLELVTKFLSRRNIGAVGNIVEARSKTEAGSEAAWDVTGSTHESMYNFDGGYTFTSSKVLRQVNAIGGLLVADCEPHGSYPATTNEIIFQHRILELGYEIESFADGEHFLVHGSEIITNDVKFRSGPFAPLLNLNGRHKVPELAELFKNLC